MWVAHMARCPSARPGVQRSGAERPEGDHPGCTSGFARGSSGNPTFPAPALPLTDVRGRRPLVQESGYPELDRNVATPGERLLPGDEMQATQRAEVKPFVFDLARSPNRTARLPPQMRQQYGRATAATLPPCLRCLFRRVSIRLLRRRRGHNRAWTNSQTAQENDRLHLRLRRRPLLSPPASEQMLGLHPEL